MATFMIQDCDGNMVQICAEEIDYALFQHEMDEYED